MPKARATFAALYREVLFVDADEIGDKASRESSGAEVGVLRSGDVTPIRFPGARAVPPRSGRPQPPAAMLRVVPLAAIAVVLLGGCRTATIREAREAEADWRRIAFAAPVKGAPGYSISMPPTLVRRPPDGPLIDYAGEDISIRFDYGPAYGQPSCALPRCTIRHLAVDGRKADTFGVGIYNPGSAYTHRMWFLIHVAGRTKLALDIACARGRSCDRAERIVRTIEFRRNAGWRTGSGRARCGCW